MVDLNINHVNTTYAQMFRGDRYSKPIGNPCFSQDSASIDVDEIIVIGRRLPDRAQINLLQELSRTLEENGATENYLYRIANSQELTSQQKVQRILELFATLPNALRDLFEQISNNPGLDESSRATARQLATRFAPIALAMSGAAAAESIRQNSEYFNAMAQGLNFLASIAGSAAIQGASKFVMAVGGPAGVLLRLLAGFTGTILVNAYFGAGQGFTPEGLRSFFEDAVSDVMTPTGKIIESIFSIQVPQLPFSWVTQGIYQSPSWIDYDMVYAYRIVRGWKTR